MPHILINLSEPYCFHGITSSGPCPDSFSAALARPSLAAHRTSFPPLLRPSQMTGTIPPNEAADGTLDADCLVAEEQRRADRAKARAAARAAAVELAQATELEAAAASMEHDAAATQARDALKCAADARTTADAPTSDDEAEDDADAKDAKDTHDSDLHRAMLMHEAATILNLHAQAVAVQNIHNLIPILLDLSAGNYARWRN